jgi:HEAT repeat protein
MGEPYAFEPLREAFEHENLGMRAIGAVSLGTLGSERAVDAVVAALSAPDEELRVAAAAPFALGQIRDERAIRPLTDMLTAEKRGARSLAADALGALGDARAAAVLHATAAKDPDASVRDAANSALTKIGA